jgi:hypothetical protein
MHRTPKSNELYSITYSKQPSGPGCRRFSAGYDFDSSVAFHSVSSSNESGFSGAYVVASAWQSPCFMLGRAPASCFKMNAVELGRNVLAAGALTFSASTASA